MVRISLETWLTRLPLQDDGHLLIGATGHLRLSASERAAVTSRLRHEALPTLIARARPRRVSLVTGLAPGADLLFKQVASQWLREAGLAFDTVALLPVPVPVLIDDWVARLSEMSVTLEPATVEAVRAGIEEQLALCAVVIDLVPGGPADPKLRLGAFRQRQYRQLAACLAEQSDVLVAILRPGHSGLPGGAADVVSWRHRPARIPAALSTLHLRRPAVAGRPLLLIDPTLAAVPGPRPADSGGIESALLDPLQQVLDACRAALKAGNYLLCHDLAERARADGLRSRELDHMALLSLANAGSTQLALRRYRELGIGADDGDGYNVEEWLSLKARLLKDLALAAPAGKAPALFVESGRVYAQAFDHAQGYFPGINAATMLMLGGHGPEALALARRVLDSLDVLADDADGADAGETERYYRAVTEAEAALLLGSLERVRGALARAAQLQPGNVNALSRTGAQLRLICRHLGHDPAHLAALAVPPVLFVPSALPAELPLPAEASFVCIGLNGPRELDIAEHYRLRGIRVHLVLPAAREQLVEEWQRHHGPAIAQRLHGHLERGGECSIAQGFLEREGDWRATYVSATACGLSRLEARRIGAGWHDLGHGGGPRAADAACGCGAPLPPHSAPGRTGQPETRRLVGTLFADFAGYSRLGDEEQPLFQEVLIGGIAAALAEHQPHILLQHTWGDAVHVVTDDAETTARIADRIHSIVERARSGLGGMLEKLELRLSAHYAPVFEGIDPVEGTTTYFGSQLSFAARVEPVTPPGMIFVTEAFAARLMLEAPDRYAAEYAGEIELAKRYGKYRLYSLRRGEADS
ncbi:MAG: hypothetical protein NTW01_14370 [Gammaproteobacteria bacterium]|nr:hypothetical protein [Gammaproteobacteria bacterium]